VQRLEAEFDRELLELASAHVRLQVAPRTWEAFHLTAVEGLTGAAVAARLSMKVAHVFVAKSEVLKRLEDEVRRLEG
jgi:RNA polymerase sigma-70 factor (ECF subfamily)